MNKNRRIVKAIIFICFALLLTILFKRYFPDLSFVPAVIFGRFISKAIPKEWIAKIVYRVISKECS